MVLSNALDDAAVLRGRISKDGGLFNWGQIGKIIVDVALGAAPVAVNLLQEYTRAQSQQWSEMDNPTALGFGSSALPSFGSVAPEQPRSYQAPDSALRQVTSLPSSVPSQLDALGQRRSTKVLYRGVPVRPEHLDPVFLTDMTYVGTGANPLTPQELEHWETVQDIHVPRVAQQGNAYYELLAQELASKPRIPVTETLGPQLNSNLKEITRPQKYSPHIIPPALVISGVEIPDRLRSDIEHANRQFKKQYGRDLPAIVLNRWLEQTMSFAVERTYGKYSYNTPLIVNRLSAEESINNWLYGQGQSIAVSFSSLNFKNGKPNVPYDELYRDALQSKKLQTRLLKNYLTNYSFSDFSTDEGIVYGNITVILDGILSVNPNGNWFYNGSIKPGHSNQPWIYPFSNQFKGDIFNFDKGNRGPGKELLVGTIHLIPGTSYLIYFTGDKVLIKIEKSN